MIEDRLKICCSVNSECEVIFDRTLGRTPGQGACLFFYEKKKLYIPSPEFQNFGRSLCPNKYLITTKAQKTVFCLL